MQRRRHRSRTVDMSGRVAADGQQGLSAGLRCSFGQQRWFGRALCALRVLEKNACGLFDAPHADGMRLSRPALHVLWRWPATCAATCGYASRAARSCAVTGSPPTARLPVRAFAAGVVAPFPAERGALPCARQHVPVAPHRLSAALGVHCHAPARPDRLGHMRHAASQQATLNKNPRTGGGFF